MTNRCTTAQSTELVRQWAPPVMVTLAAAATLMVLTAAPPAGAAPRQAPPEKTTDVAAPRSAGESIMAIISIKSQKVTIYDADGWILRAPVSSGTKGRETPAGVFSVVQKDRDHRSTLYDDAWMPHMLRITWNGVALHGGPLPGYAASHGCVRMPFGFAEKLFDKVPIGTRVIISPSDAFFPPTSSMSLVRRQRWTDTRRRPAGCGSPSRNGTSGCMPALMNRAVGSFSGTSGADGRRWCPRHSKKRQYCSIKLRVSISSLPDRIGSGGNKKARPRNGSEDERCARGTTSFCAALAGRALRTLNRVLLYNRSAWRGLPA